MFFKLSVVPEHLDSGFPLIYASRLVSGADVSISMPGADPIELMLLSGVDVLKKRRVDAAEFWDCKC